MNRSAATWLMLGLIFIGLAAYVGYRDLSARFATPAVALVQAPIVNPTPSPAPVPVVTQPSLPPPPPPDIQEIREPNRTGKTYILQPTEDFLGTIFRINRDLRLCIDANGKFAVRWAETNTVNGQCGQPNHCEITICPMGTYAVLGGHCTGPFGNGPPTFAIDSFKPVSALTQIFLRNTDVDPITINMFYVDPNLAF